MAQIYRCSYCTIAINIPEKQGQPFWTHCGYTGDGSASGWVMDHINSGTWNTKADNLWMSLLKGGILGSRAWCFQERQLSPRMFHFLDPGMIMWECCHFVAAIGGPIIFGIRGTHSKDVKPDTDKRLIDIEPNYTHGDPSGQEMEQRSLSDSLVLFHRHYAEKTVMKAWYSALPDYTSRSLTYETDRPVAILGLVNWVRHITNFTYCQGIWVDEPYHVRSLLWERHGSAGEIWTRSVGISGDTAPTWSWLSICGPVKGVSGNDEDTNPPFMEDTRDFRPVFDHSYQALATVRLSFSENGKKLSIEAPSISATLSHRAEIVPNMNMRHQAREIPIVAKVHDNGGLRVGYACLDLPQESYHGPVTLVALTAQYGVVLTQEEGRPQLYRRLGTARIRMRDDRESWFSDAFQSRCCIVI